MFSAPYDSPLKQSSIVQKDVFWYPAELWKNWYKWRSQNMLPLQVVHKKPIHSYSHVRGDIDQMSTNTSRCSICCAANVYIFVYILMGFLIVPLKVPYGFQSVCKQKCKHLVHCKWYNLMYLLTFGQCHTLTL